MIIKIERSGGLTGLRKMVEIDSENLPPSLVKSARKIMNVKQQPLQMKSKGADYYNYKLTIQDGKQQKVIDCTESNIDDDELKSLIHYMEKSLKKNK